jgi:hypothetical protein
MYTIMPYTSDGEKDRDCYVYMVHVIRTEIYNIFFVCGFIKMTNIL